MKRIIFLLTIAAFLACNNATEQDATTLPGEFKYTAYNWNEAGDSLGVSLLHYMQIAEDGNYRLIQRDANGNAVYYYGFIGYEQVVKLSRFMADSSLSGNYMDSADTGPTYLFDYSNMSGEQKVKFTKGMASEAVQSTQVLLDSLIGVPNKKTTSFFNIDTYLRGIIREDSAARN